MTRKKPEASGYRMKMLHGSYDRLRVPVLPQIRAPEDRISGRRVFSPSDRCHSRGETIGKARAWSAGAPAIAPEASSPTTPRSQPGPVHRRGPVADSRPRPAADAVGGNAGRTALRPSLGTGPCLPAPEAATPSQRCPLSGRICWKPSACFLGPGRVRNRVQAGRGSTVSMSAAGSARLTGRGRNGASSSSGPFGPQATFSHGTAAEAVTGASLQDNL